MEFTEILGVDEEAARQLRAAGLRTIRDLQLASREDLVRAVGEELADGIIDRVGSIHLDEEGRTDYLRTLGIREERELEGVEVGPITEIISRIRPEAARAKKIKFVIERSAGQAGQRENHTYEIEAQPGWTVLDALHYIKEEKDSTLSFRRSCGQAVCGICAVRINRIPMLACNTQISKVLGRDGTISIGPLNNLPSMRDLASDFDPFWKEVHRIKPWLMRDPAESLSPDAESLMYPQDLPDVIQMGNCINCAVCFSDCDARRSAQEGFLGPMAAAKLYRFVADPRDAAALERLALAEERGIWKCMYAYQCAWCPKGVEPQDAIAMLRKLIIRHRGYGHPGARHSLAFIRSARDYGRLNERTLPIITNGFWRTLLDLPLAIKWLLHGKYPKVHKIAGRGEVKRALAFMEKKIKAGERQKGEGKRR